MLSKAFVFVMLLRFRNKTRTVQCLRLLAFSLFACLAKFGAATFGCGKRRCWLGASFETFLRLAVLGTLGAFGDLQIDVHAFSRRNDLAN